MGNIKIVRLMILTILIISIAEFCLHITYRLVKGFWIWQKPSREIFNICVFTESVPDDRSVTNKKNFNCVYAEKYIYSGCLREGKDKGWEIRTDSNGFRIGKNKYFDDSKNIVFLGESVNFGWGLNGDQSVPSKFYEIINDNSSKNHGVINACIPSYSLYQAIKRYEYEINCRFPVSCVILQCFNQVNYFLVLGKEWNNKVSISTIIPKSLKHIIDNFIKHKKKLSRILFMINKYSSINYLIGGVIRLKSIESIARDYSFDINDEKTLAFFEKENLSILKDFNKTLEKNGTVLIILPINPLRSVSLNDDSAYRGLSSTDKTLLTIINKFNNLLKTFAEKHKNVYYFDIVSYFDTFDRSDLFIDDYHLSEYGAEKQAYFIFEQLKAVTEILK